MVKVKTTLISSELETPKNKGVVQTKEGRNGGTWIHPELVVEFGRWVDIRFSIFCNKVVKEVLSGMTDEQQWDKVRIRTKMRCQDRNDAINFYLEAFPDDINIQKWERSNDAMMVNRVVTGKWAPLDRDSLEADQLNLMDYIERMDAALLYQKKDLKEREEELQAMKQKFLDKHQK